MDAQRYDSELEMFVEEPHDLDRAMLLFLRWMMETGRLTNDGEIVGLPGEV